MQAIDQRDRELMGALQNEIPLVSTPFAVIGQSIDMSEKEVIKRSERLKRGTLRRFCAAPARKTGFSASAMGVWIVPEATVEQTAAKMSQHREVSHCYLRPVYADWPYNLYTIVHGRSVDECESIINDLAIDTGVEARQALYPTREYKKARISLFSAEAEEWEAARGGNQVASAAS